MYMRSAFPMRLLILLGTMLLLHACAGVPEALRHDAVVEVSPTEARTSEASGQWVRWGGEIIATRTSDDQTCLEVLRRPLDSRGRPAGGDYELGRFIACTPVFRDPFVYSAGRQVTILGRVTEPIEDRIDEHRYVYPALELESVHLWPEPDPAESRYRDPHWDPFWDPYWDPWWPYGPYRHPHFWRR